MWHSGPEARWNWIGYANARVDALIEQAEAAPSREQALEHWRAMQAEIYRDQPYLFLYWADEVVAVNQRLRNVGVGLEAPWYGLDDWELAP
jgi:ABC-type transport system substrate-binding protein